MKKINKFIYLGSFALLLISGCTITNTPFTPVAVPNATTLKAAPGIEKDCRVDRKALMELQKVGVPDYVIMPGDTLVMTIPNREDLSRSGMIVMSDGAISVAPIGRVRIGGLTLTQASEKLSRCYRKYIRDCKIILEPASVQQAKVILTGAINKGGSAIPIFVGKTRLRDVIAQAGGLQFTEKQESLADLKHAVIIRNSKVLPVNFELLMNTNDQLQNIPLLDGDYINIPSLNNTRIIVLGEKGSTQIYQPGTTLLEVVAKAGGVTSKASKHIKVIRGGLANPIVYNINIRDMQLGKIQDFPMQPKDIVYMPLKPLCEWNEIIGQIMPTVQLINGLAGPFGNPGSFVYQSYYNK